MTPVDPSDIVLLSAVRTPIGALLGRLAGVPAHALGAVAVRAAVARAGADPAAIDEVTLGNVLMAGQGQAPARQAALGAGLPRSVPATTINKMCGSGLKAMMLAHDALRAGNGRLHVAGGMESMSRAPHLLPGLRSGRRYGHAEVLDHMAVDGLEDAYEPRTPMGAFAERTAQRYGFSRETQDTYAIESLRRARAAFDSGVFAWELEPVAVEGPSGTTTVDRDETPERARPEKIPQLRPAFAPDGTVTAASSASISDGAAATVLSTASHAADLGLQPLARIVAHASHARAPEEFTLAPIQAIAKVLDRAGWHAADVDLWEINEAFAVVSLAAIREHRLDPARVNVHGGACALGHPIGASGTRLVATLLGALRRHHARRGVVALCIGGGEAVAMAIERL